jgi:hypothetical protein
MVSVLTVGADTQGAPVRADMLVRPFSMSSALKESRATFGASCARSSLRLCLRRRLCLGDCCEPLLAQLVGVASLGSGAVRALSPFPWSTRSEAPLRCRAISRSGSRRRFPCAGRR